MARATLKNQYEMLKMENVGALIDSDDYLNTIQHQHISTFIENLTKPKLLGEFHQMDFLQNEYTEINEFIKVFRKKIETTNIYTCNKEGTASKFTKYLFWAILSIILEQQKGKRN
ncbi:hypothetical protein CIPAW_11G062400 [Carya illinoinensis]|uniref:Uncharacterized protein n=1 Tax=Carya illinoinensis TaxID=32201 RepID=A0A8T1P1I2_CARIL|nr:hypothetical protein CIPAW_11G062400 [Carya illinoinensis]